jgi:hypothetical protein
MIIQKFITIFLILLINVLQSNAQKATAKFNFDEKNGDIVIKENSFTIPTLNNEVFYETIFNFPESITDEQIYRGAKKLFENFALKPSIGITLFRIFELRGQINQITYEDKDEKIVSGYLGFISEKEKGNRDKLLRSGDIITCKTTFLIKNQKLKIFIEDVEFYNTNAARQAVGTALSGPVFGQLTGFSHGSFNEMLQVRLNKVHENYQITFNEGLSGYSTDYYIRKLPEALKKSILEIIEAGSKYTF